MKGREVLVLLKDGREARDISGLKEEHQHSGGTFAEHQSVVRLGIFLHSAAP